MEHPRNINRFLPGLLGAFTAAVLVASICFQNFHLLGGWLVALAGFFLLCVLFALLNIAIFAPLFRLVARFDVRKADKRARED